MSTSQNSDLTRQFNTDGAKNAPLVKPVVIYEHLLSSVSGHSAKPFEQSASDPKQTLTIKVGGPTLEPTGNPAQLSGSARPHG